MKKTMYLIVGVLALTAMSFTAKTNSGVILMPNGNYSVPEFGVVSSGDAVVLSDLAVTGQGTTQAIHTSVAKTFVSETVWVTTDKIAMMNGNPEVYEARHQAVICIMQKYL